MSISTLTWLIVAVGTLAVVLFAPTVLIALRERWRPEDMPATGRVRVRHYNIAYTDAGPRDGRPVVLLHGFAAWSFTWREQQAALAEAGYRVISIDQLGNGASDRIVTNLFATQDQAENMIAVLDALEIASADLVGHSFGGRLAMQIALLQPHRVKSLVLLAPEAFATARPPIAQIVTWPVIGYLLGYYATLTLFVGPSLRMVSRNHAWLTSKAVKGYTRSLRVWGSLLSQIAMSSSPKDRPDLPVPASLGQIGQRAMIIWGDKDPVFPATDGERLTQIMPNARLSVLSKCGHLPHEEYHAEVSAAIIAHVG